MLRLAGLAASLLLVSGLASGAAPADARPSVLFITVDDMGWDSVGVDGSSVPESTPNIDRLASQGMRFDHAHSTIAICQPTRAVWMTSRYPHENGAIGFNRIRAGIPTLPETLRAHGYATGILGKTKHVIPSRRGAFEYVRTGKELGDGRSPPLYAEATREFLAAARGSGRPFFLMVNTHDPHRPFDDRKPAEARKIAVSGAAKGKHLSGDPPAPSRIYGADEIAVPGFLPDLPAIREEMAGYYSSVRRADDVVGAVLEILAGSGFEGSTLVMFTSDHGISMPFAKANVWRSSTHTPWIVRWPGVVAPGTRDSRHMISGVDFAPTILEALGIEPMEGMEGRSFLPLLRGQPQEGWDHVYTYFYLTARKRVYPMRSVQDVRYGYIWNGWSNGRTKLVTEGQRGLSMSAMKKAAETDPAIAARVRHYLYRVPEEFYDYAADPDALHDLIDDPAMQDRIAAARARLLEHMERTGDPERRNFEKVVRP